MGLPTAATTAGSLIGGWQFACLTGNRPLGGGALRLATTPCGPLYGRSVSPDRELGALLRSIAA
jgi:hypothetical protein